MFENQSLKLLLVILVFNFLKTDCSNVLYSHFLHSKISGIIVLFLLYISSMVSWIYSNFCIRHVDFSQRICFPSDNIMYFYEGSLPSLGWSCIPSHRQTHLSRNWSVAKAEQIWVLPKINIHSISWWMKSRRDEQSREWRENQSPDEMVELLDPAGPETLCISGFSHLNEPRLYVFLDVFQD